MADGQVQVDILGNTSDFDKAVDGLTDKVSAKTIALGNVLADLAKKALSSLAGAVSDAIDTGMTFESSMSNVTALQQAAGATADDLAMLKQAAEDFGASTQYTMAECADALGFMALAGWDASKSVEALPGVLSLAASSGMGLAQASDMVTDYMSAFSGSISDLTGEMLTAAEFSDKLAYAQANSNTTAAMLGEAYKNCAANLNAAGQQMDTVTALLGTMANQGLKGSEAGTAVTAMMRDITNSMKDGAIQIGETSVAVADANGNYLDLIDIAESVEAATSGMGEAERAAALSATFTADSIKGMNLILNAGTDAVRELEAGLSDCEGAADEMAKTMNDNLAGDLTYMQSALDAVKNSIYEGINPALRSLVQTVTNDVAPNLTTLVNGLIGAANGMDGAGSQIRSSVSALGEVLKNTILDALQQLPDMFKAGLDLKDAILMEIAELLPAVLPALTETIYEMARQFIAGIPLMVQAAANLIQGIADALIGIDFSGMMTDLISIMANRLRSGSNILVHAATSLFSSIIDALPAMTEGGMQIVNALLNAVTGMLPKLLPLGTELLETLAGGLSTAVPELAAFAQQFITSLGVFLQENLPQLAEDAKAFMNTYVQALGQYLPVLAESGLAVVTSLAEFIQENLPLLISAAVEILNTLVQILVENVPMLLDVAIELLSALAEMLIENAVFLADAAVELVLTLVQMLMDCLPELLTAAVQIVFRLAQMLIENAVLLVGAATELIGTLAQMFIDNMPELLTAAVQIVFSFAQMLIENLPMLLDAALALILALVQMIAENMDAVLDAALAIIMAIAEGLADDLPVLVTAAMQIILTLVKDIISYLPKLAAVSIQIIETLVKFLAAHTGELIQAGIDILMALITGEIDALPELAKAVGEIMEALLRCIADHLGDILQAGIDILMELIAGTVSAVPELVMAVGEIIGTIWNSIIETDWKALGINILSGLAKGLTEGISTVWDTINGVGESIKDGFKDFFGIHSPSTLMRDEIGKFLMPGISVGIDASADDAADALNGALEGMMDSIDPESLRIQLQAAAPSLHLPSIEMPDRSAFARMLDKIDIDGLMLRLNASMQIQSAAAVPPDFVQMAGAARSADNADDRKAHSDPTGWEGDMIFHISFGNEPFDSMVISAIDRMNAVSGGVMV